MEQIIAVTIFKICWGFLLAVAVTAQAIFGGKLIKKAGIVTNLIVAMPYLIVFGWFSVRNQFGLYKSFLLLEICGLLLMLVGISGYITSIFFLRRNWAVSAAIKEGHKLIKKGPYKFVRHPMYFFMIIFIFGSGLIISNYLILLYTPVIVLIYYLRARKEEELLKENFPEYAGYIKETKMLIPKIF